MVQKSFKLLKTKCIITFCELMHCLKLHSGISNSTENDWCIKNVWHDDDDVLKHCMPQGQHCSKIMKAAAKLTTANGGTFTWAQLDSVANHVTARSIGDWCAITRLATATGELDVNVPPFAVVSLSVSTWLDTTWIGGMASRLYMCKSVLQAVSHNISRKHRKGKERKVQ